MSTIYDVATRARVSPKTVSRVLNGDAPVGEATRAAVEAAIAELGYVPSRAARMMRSNRSGLIGIITGAISSSPEPNLPAGLPELVILQGIQAELSGGDRTIMIADTGSRMERVPGLIRTFLQHRVEGLIYVVEYHQEVVLPMIPDTTPIVLANCFDEMKTPAVLPDDRTGQYDLTARLIASGHRRIAYLTLRGDLPASRERIDGFSAAHQDAGLSLDPLLIRRVGFEGRPQDAAKVAAVVEEILALKDRPTSICCGNDAMAMQVYGILRSKGLDVPEDISVAGYDNYRAIAENLYPALTTMELPYHAIGRAAAKRLVDLIRGAQPNSDARSPDPQRVTGDICWRSSVTVLSPDSLTPDSTDQIVTGGKP